MNHANQLAPYPSCLKYLVTKREKEILIHMSEGKTDVKIAKLLFISPYTVNTHRKNLMQKFNAKNSCQLMFMVCSNNIL